MSEGIMDTQLACWHFNFSQFLLESLHLCMRVYESCVVLKFSGVGVFGEEKNVNMLQNSFFFTNGIFAFPPTLHPHQHWMD